MNSKEVWTGGIDIVRSDDHGANWGIAGYWSPTDENRCSRIPADVHSILFHPEYGKKNHTPYDENSRVHNTRSAALAVTLGLNTPPSLL